MYPFIRKHKTPIDETVKFVFLLALGGSVLYYLSSPLISRMLAAYAELAVANYFASEEPSVVNNTCEFIHSKIPAVPVALCESDVTPFVNETLTGLETTADQKIDGMSDSGNIYLAAYSLLILAIGYMSKPIIDRAYSGVGTGISFLYKKCTGDITSEETQPLHVPESALTGRETAISINF